MAKIKQFTEADGALNGYKVKIDEVDGKFIYLLQDTDGQKMESKNKSETYESAKEAFKAAKAELNEKVGNTEEGESENTDNEQADTSTDDTTDEAEDTTETDDTTDDTTETDDTVTESVFDKLFTKIISENNLVNEWDQFVQDAQPEELEGTPVVSAYDEGPYNVEDIMSDIDACETEEEQNEIIDGVKANHPELFEDLIGALQASADGANNADSEADADAAYYQSLANYAISIR